MHLADQKGETSDVCSLNPSYSVLAHVSESEKRELQTVALVKGQDEHA